PDGKIIEGPLTVVGYADLVDESTTAPAVNKLHVIVAAGSPATPGATYVDYTVSGSVTGSPPTAFTATAAGFVTDLTRTLTFNATFGVTNVDTDNPDGQIDATWDLDNPAIHIELHETIATPNANEIDVTLTDFSFTRGTQKVSEHGSLSIVASPQTVTVNLAIDVNGELWAGFSAGGGAGWRGFTCRAPCGASPLNTRGGFARSRRSRTRCGLARGSRVTAAGSSSTTSFPPSTRPVSPDPRKRCSGLWCSR